MSRKTKGVVALSCFGGAIYSYLYAVHPPLAEAGALSIGLFSIWIYLALARAANSAALTFCLTAIACGLLSLCGLIGAIFSTGIYAFVVYRESRTIT